MRALIYDGDLRFDSAFAIPKPSENEALLKIRRAGICNTDLELIAGMYDFTGILGHEFVAEVVEGPQELCGSRVVGEINVTCEACDFCHAGIPSMCRNRRAIGIHELSGAFADYLTLPLRNLYTVPASVDDDQAVFTEPLAAALQVTEGVHISPRHHVVVLGAGKLGMLVAQVLHLTGADVVVVVRHDHQVELLDRWGIESARIETLTAHRAQVVVDCTGQASGFADALELIESRGTIVLKSTYKGLPQADLTYVAVNEIRVVGSRCGPFEAALRLLESDLVDVKSLIDARYDFASASQAIERAGQRGTFKVLLDF